MSIYEKCGIGEDIIDILSTQNPHLDIDDLDDAILEVFGKDPFAYRFDNSPESLRDAGLIQEVKQLMYFAQQMESNTNNILVHFPNIFQGIRDIGKVNTTPLLLGWFTNLTAYAFLEINKIAAQGTPIDPVIMDPYTYPNASAHIKKNALLVGGNGKKIPFDINTITSIQSDFLFTFITRFNGDVDGIAEEMYRVLVPQGRVVLVESRRYSQGIKNRLENAGFRILDEDNNGQGFTPFCYEKLSDAIQGLELLGKEGGFKGWLADHISSNKIEDSSYAMDLIVAEK